MYIKNILIIVAILFKKYINKDILYYYNQVITFDMSLCNKLAY